MSWFRNFSPVWKKRLSLPYHGELFLFGYSLSDKPTRNSCTSRTHCVTSQLNGQFSVCTHRALIIIIIIIITKSPNTYDNNIRTKISGIKYWSRTSKSQLQKAVRRIRCVTPLNKHLSCQTRFAMSQVRTTEDAIFFSWTFSKVRRIFKH
jgi:hypothetical protein